ncbi:glucosamine-6-phosphate deaminase [Domibacillus enclensis]|uniref:Glucosamine-6-phosphate deaminase n=1 Tax=Domibacillus enclensis TaxID=1017273 RepID=A0A1N6NFI0_9BACI|nr:glucosamine-6-phosphate deaminase [Domibacillus enclensis]OXS80032.1 glucosamine-6-phosphate deaminase [Domibacillus enclensis]SIP90803.1 glucosamine-6-phosphate deaminase [Domibacillus enclensis]
MNIVRASNYEDMSKKAAEYVLRKLSEKPDAVLGLATGSTPAGLYEQLIIEHQKRNVSYRQIRTINLDEYIGLPADDENSYHSFMNTQLFRHIDIPLANTHLPNGEAADLPAECSRYEALIDHLGIDLQLLGIGENGHIGFNEPGTSFGQTTHMTTLAESTRQANARFFPSIEAVPQQAITMGIASIMKSREILLMASGRRKAAAIERLMSGETGEDFPASVLHRHPHVTILADEEALSTVT